MRIIHISDLHFGMHDPDIIEPFIEDLALLKPEIIIISGDLTQRARAEQFQQLSEFLQRLGAPQLIVPGNHDIPMDNLFLRFYHPFKRFKTYVSPNLEMSYENEEVKILGVNSATPYKVKDGILSAKTLTRINNHFSTNSTQLNILFFHHNLKYFSGMHHPLNNATEFLEYLKESPIHVVCTGHLHYSNLKLITKKQGTPCALLHAGSLCCQRTRDENNSFYFINTEQLRCSINRRIYASSTFSSAELYLLDFSAQSPWDDMVEN
ncbi:metallophosphoesterase family protein [Legionella rowbothamii]|uniref:metallophosphoesterase family protein n=1 Tax=Legionella rowbothamii TaxID=96229 RepID=UPI0010545CA2|nr:metallophosphoesterase [Legionella rowbothamii]